MKNQSDPSHEATDKEILNIEREIAKEYELAHKEVTKKLNNYLERFAEKDEVWRKSVENGTKTEKDYIEWRKGQIIVGKRWENMCDALATDYTHVSQIAQSIAKKHAPEVYSTNYNYETYDIEHQSQIDTSFTLYSRETIERMYRDDPKLYHNYGKAVAKNIKEGKQHAWDKRRVKSVITQAVLQGESIPKIVKRLEAVTGGDHKSAVRNARTMMTGVENAGRIDAMDRVKQMGIPIQKQWLATLDNRTRHWHRELDGVTVDIDKPFENAIGKIMFPADPDADPANVYNCRCTLITSIKGFEIDTKDLALRHSDHLGNMTYDEWLAGKKSINNVIGGAKASVGEKMNRQLGESYEYHRISNRLNATSYEEMQRLGVNIIASDFSNLSEKTARAFEDTLTNLMSEYDTTLQSVRSMTRTEALGNTAFASVYHDYTVDKSTLLINPVKCKNFDKMVTRIMELSEKRYCVKISEAQASKYVATHEFAHTLLDMKSPLKSKTNWLGADYNKVKTVRKEIKSIYDDYLNEIRPIQEKAKQLELDYILTFNEKSAEEARRLFDELDRIKLSDYSLESADEFMAEAFTHSRFSKERNKYADRVRKVIDKHYKR